MTLAQLAKASSYSERTLSRVMGGDALPTLECACALAIVLGLDVPHVVLTLAREMLGVRGRGRLRADADGEVSLNAVAAAAEELTAHLAWQRSRAQYTSHNRGTRLAFRKARIAAGLSRDELAVELTALLRRDTSRPTPSVAQWKQQLLAFEHDLYSPDDHLLHLYAVALTLARPECGRVDLEREGRSLLEMHVVDDTMEAWSQLKPRNSMKVTDDILLRRSLSVFGGLEVEELMAAPNGDPKRLPHIYNAHHQGLEIAQCIGDPETGGAVTLYLTRTQIDDWADLASDSLGDNLVTKRKIKAGQSVIFPSGYWHHVELSRHVTIRSINIGGNLWLARKLRGHLSPQLSRTVNHEASATRDTDRASAAATRTPPRKRRGS